VDTRAIAYAALDGEECAHWYGQKDEELRKALVVYSHKGQVVGKAVVLLAKGPLLAEEEQPPLLEDCPKLRFRIIEAIPATVAPLLLSLGSGEGESVLVGQEYEFRLARPVYCYQVAIENEQGDSRCLFSL
jgi:hypothetical protein